MQTVDGPTPIQTLNAVTAILSPHIAQLLDPSTAFPVLEHDSIPTVASLLSSSLLQCEQSIHSHSLSLPSPAELQSLSVSLSASLTALQALSQQGDVEAALSVYFSIAEAVALLPLLLSSAGAGPSPPDSSSLSLFRSVLSAWQQAYPSQGSARDSSASQLESMLPGAVLTAEADAAAIIKCARGMLSSHFLPLLQQLSQPAADGDEETANHRQALLLCFQTLSHLLHPSSLAAHFCAFLSSRYGLREQPALLRPLSPAASQPELSAAWAVYTERIVSAFQQQLPVLSQVILPSLPSPSALPPLLHEAFVSPFLSLCCRFLQLHDHSLAACAFLLPQLSCLSSQLSTLASTFFSLSMPAATLPCPLPPQTLLACITASLPEAKAEAERPKAMMDDVGGMVREDVLRRVRLCDTLLEVMDAVDERESSRSQPELISLLRRLLLGWTAGRKDEQQQAGLRSLLLELSSLACVLHRWIRYQQALLPASQRATSGPSQQPPLLPSCLTSSSFNSQLQLLLRAQPPASTVPPLQQRRLPTLPPVTGAQAEKEPATPQATAGGWAEVEDEIRSLILTTLRGCEAEVVDCLQVVAEGWTAIDWPRKRDWPPGMRPALSAPSAPVRHLNFFLCSTRQYLSRTLPSSCSAVSSLLMTHCLHQAALLSLSLLTSACPSRHHLPQYRLDLVATVLLLSSHLRLQQRQPGTEDSRGQLAAVLAWLVLGLGVLEAEPELVATAVGQEEAQQAETAAEQDASAVTAVLGAWEEATAGSRSDAGVEMERLCSWTAVEWSAAWQEVAGAGCRWAEVLTARHAVCIARAVGCPTLRLRSWASKRFDMQSDDFPALTEEQERRAQPLRQCLLSGSSQTAHCIPH